MQDQLLLREVVPDDLPIFFELQPDPEANTMAAFTAKDPSDRDGFMSRWHRILTKTIGELTRFQITNAPLFIQENELR